RRAPPGLPAQRSGGVRARTAHEPGETRRGPPRRYLVSAIRRGNTVGSRTDVRERDPGGRLRLPPRRDTEMSERYDAVVIGAGPAGEVAASRLPKLGLRTALVERELVGGECAYWACIPSKTLLRPPEVRAEARHAAGLGDPGQRWQEIVAYRDYMTRSLDDSGAVKGYEDYGVRVYRGEARIT